MDISIIFSNVLINQCLIAWASAQLIKTIINAIQNKKFDRGRLAGAGGMPSAHSAVVCSVTLTSLYEYGIDSPIFGLAFILSSIVMYDATGVRWAAGLHAKAINNLVDYLGEDGNKEKVELQSIIPKLNESLGHRFVEVICGALLGIVIAVLSHYVRYGTFI